MIVRTLDEVRGSEDEVEGPGWTSRRLLLAKHGMGFSMHDTVVPAGASLELWYKHHLEAVYCVEGRGRLRCRDTDRAWDIAPGTVYALDAHDRHTLTAIEPLRLVCVFNPPVTGSEVHDADGAYALPEGP